MAALRAVSLLLLCVCASNSIILGGPSRKETLNPNS